MTTSSPLRANLINLQITPAKVIVSYDINSWFETNGKKQNEGLIKLRCKSKHTFGRIPHKASSNEITNLASLREKRMKLLQSSSKKHRSQQILSQTTKPSPKLTLQSNPQKIKSIQRFQKQNKQFKLKLTEIKVSQFKSEQATIRPFDLKFQYKGLPHICSRSLQQTKNNLHRLRNIQMKIQNNKLAISNNNQNQNHKNINYDPKNVIFKTRRIVHVNHPLLLESIQ